MGYKSLISSLAALAAAVIGLSREAEGQGIEIEQEIRSTTNCDNGDSDNHNNNNDGCVFTQEELEDICDQFRAGEPTLPTEETAGVGNPCVDNPESQIGRPVARINRSINNNLQFQNNLEGTPYIELTFDGSESFDPDGGEIQRYRWIITGAGLNGENREEQRNEYHSASITLPAYISGPENVNEIDIVLHVWDDEGTRSHRARDHIAFVYTEREIQFVDTNDDNDGNNENEDNNNEDDENGSENESGAEQEAQQIELNEQDRQLLDSILSQISQITAGGNNGQPLINVSGGFRYSFENHVGEDGYFALGDTITISGSLILNPNILVDLAGMNPFIGYERTELVDEPQVETHGFESLQINDYILQQWQIGLRMPSADGVYVDLLFDGRSVEFSADGTNRLGEPITRDGNRNYNGVGVDLDIFEQIYAGVSLFDNIEDSDLDTNSLGFELRASGNTGDSLAPFEAGVSVLYNLLAPYGNAYDPNVHDNAEFFETGLELCYNLAGVSGTSGLEVDICGNLGYESLNAVQGNRAYDHSGVNGGLSIEFDYAGLNIDNTDNTDDPDGQNTGNTGDDE